MPLQAWIHHWEEGAGAKILRASAALLAFVALASLYDVFCYENFSSEEAMETAQLARNVSEGKGCTTDSVRPLALYLLENAAATGQSSKVLAQRVPDLSNPPIYPFLLAGLMKVLPFQFIASQLWYYEPERWISLFNQALFFASVILLFLLARSLFDSRVAWVSAVLFAGTKLFWRFSDSGLSTQWLILVFLMIVWLMAAIERRERAATTGGGVGTLLLALLLGLLVGVGGLSRYAFGWIILPVILFVGGSAPRGKIRLGAAVLLAFLAVMAPWVARNYSLGGHFFGTADFAVVEGTTQFPGNALERSTDPRNGLRRLAPGDVLDKFATNAQAICATGLPEWGGNWIVAFFFAGLMVPFRNIGLTRLRWFLLGSVALFIVAQALGRTEVSNQSPEVNSENLLVILAPLAFIYGVAFFHTLLDQLNLVAFDARGAAVILLVAVTCAPFLLTLFSARHIPANWPYAPRHIQRVAHWMQPSEMLMSDIPSGVAWYGDRSCAWLSLDYGDEFFKVNALKPVKALFLTQVTTDEHFLSQMKSDTNGWGPFVLKCAEHSDLPEGFPLRKAPEGLLPEQLFLSDNRRW